jgi:predicted dehydrogenase
MADKIKIGLIGLGRISTLHLNAYKEEFKLNAEIVALCDSNKGKVKEIGDSLNVEAIYTDYKDLLNDNNVDAVEILTPHHMHTEHTVAAAKAGKAISLQKVPCLTLSQMDQMIDAAKKNKVKFRVFENFRFYEPYMKAMELIKAGKIGKVERVDYRMWGGMRVLSSWKVPISAWKWRISEKGNYKSPTIFDDGYHKHSVIAQFLGQPIDSVLAWQGVYKIAGAVKLDTPTVIVYSCKNKAHYGTWNTSTHGRVPMHSKYYGCDEYVDIVGDNGAIFIPGCTGSFFEDCDTSGPGKAGVHWVEKDGVWKSDLTVNTDWADSFVNCSREFIEAIREDRQPEVNPKEARYILQIGLGIIRSVRNNFKEVKLKDVIDTP